MCKDTYVNVCARVNECPKEVNFSKIQLATKFAMQNNNRAEFLRISESFSLFSENIYISF